MKITLAVAGVTGIITDRKYNIGEFAASVV